MASIKDSLKAKRDEIAARQVRTVKVPRWEDPTLAFVVRSVDEAAVTRVSKKVNRNQPDANSEAAALLVALAIGAGPGVVFSGRDPMTIKELGTELGLPDDASAASVLREVVITDGDMNAIAETVREFSGFTEGGVPLLDVELAGE